MLAEPIAVTLPVVDALEELGIPYIPNRLDQDYLRKWAGELGVVDLLQRAFKDIGVN